ncbi:unnamed protein product, partial [Didymodactylos carnosus]
SFCRTLGLIPYSPSAPCTNGHHKWYMGKSSRAHDKYQSRCRAKGCKLTRSIRDGTFFSTSRLSIQQLLDLMFYWSQGLDSHKDLRRHCNLASESTIVDWKNFLRDICAEFFLRHPGVIGWIGHVVEIDESSWTKRKYNRGRVVPNQWVFGGIDGDTRKCFAVTVNRRDAATLLPIIQQYVRPGSAFHIDSRFYSNTLAETIRGLNSDDQLCSITSILFYTKKNRLYFKDIINAIISSCEANLVHRCWPSSTLLLPLFTDACCQIGQQASIVDGKTVLLNGQRLFTVG